MFVLIPGLPPFVVGVRVVGTITGKDYSTTLLPALKKASAEWKGINLLFVLETELKNFTAGAWLQDVKTNVAYFMKWNKIAMVANNVVLDKMTAIFEFVTPGEARSFCLEQLHEAKEWISEP